MNAPTIQMKLDSRVSEREPHLQRALSAGEGGAGGRGTENFFATRFSPLGRGTRGAGVANGIAKSRRWFECGIRASLTSSALVSHLQAVLLPRALTTPTPHWPFPGGLIRLPDGKRIRVVDARAESELACSRRDSIPSIGRRVLVLGRPPLDRTWRSAFAARVRAVRRERLVGTEPNKAKRSQKAREKFWRKRSNPEIRVALSYTRLRVLRTVPKIESEVRRPHQMC